MKRWHNGLRAAGCGVAIVVLAGIGGPAFQQGFDRMQRAPDTAPGVASGIAGGSGAGAVGGALVEPLKPGDL